MERKRKKNPALDTEWSLRNTKDLMEFQLTYSYKNDQNWSEGLK